MGLEGLVSKRRDRPYQGGMSRQGIKMLWGGADGEGCGTLGALSNDTNGAPHVATFDASRSLTAFEQDSTIIAAIEMVQSKWLVAAVVPGIKRQPLKKLDADEESLLKLLHRWRKEADQAGRPIRRVVVAYEAGRDGFWLVRWPRMRGVEAYVIHPNSIAVSREHRRAKTDRRIVNQIKAILTRFGIRTFWLEIAQSRGTTQRGAHRGRITFARKHPCRAVSSPRTSTHGA
jgi:hypothetical protein